VGARKAAGYLAPSCHLVEQSYFFQSHRPDGGGIMVRGIAGGAEAYFADEIQDYQVTIG